MIAALGAVTPKLFKRPQKIPRTTSEISVQKSTMLGAAPRHLGEDMELQGYRLSINHEIIAATQKECSEGVRAARALLCVRNLTI